MDSTTFHALYDDCRRALSERRLLDAIRALEGILSLSDDWQSATALAEVRESYLLLLDYFRQGAVDEQRNVLVGRFTSATAEIADRLYHRFLLQDASCLLGRTAATLERLRMAAWPELLTRLESLPVEPFTAERALLLQHCFESLFISGICTPGEAGRLTRAVCGGELPVEDRCLLVSAATLSLLSVFDATKLHFLLDIAFADAAAVPPMVQVRAEVGFVFGLIRHNDRLKGCPELLARLELLADEPAVRRSLADLQIIFYLTLETKRIEKSLREEIMPEMVKGTRNLRLDKSIGLDELQERLEEFNPEWKDTRMSEQLQRKMAEIAALQAKGADIYMGTFSHLKHKFPFFASAANWFYPFTFRHPQVDGRFRRNSAFQRLLHHGALCDSDQYSFCFLFSSMSAALQGGPAGVAGSMDEMLSQLAGQTGDAAEQETAVDPLEQATVLRRMYVQDFYRFVKLFHGCDRSLDPFLENLTLADYAPLGRCLSDEAVLHDFATFCFGEKQWEQALFYLEKLTAPTAEVFQKQGYCLLRLQRTAEAAACLEKANLLKPSSPWTLRQLATCHRRLGNYAQAAAYYEELGQLKPEETAHLLRQAECYIKTERYEDAFRTLYKADYLMDDSDKPLRALAWCSLLTRQPEKAETYYARLLAASPTATDYLNAGHTAWALENTAEAVRRYREGLKLEGQVQAAPDFLTADAEVLRLYGKTLLDIRLMTDVLNL